MLAPYPRVSWGAEASRCGYHRERGKFLLSSHPSTFPVVLPKARSRCDKWPTQGVIPSPGTFTFLFLSPRCIGMFQWKSKPGTNSTDVTCSSWGLLLFTLGGMFVLIIIVAVICYYKGWKCSSGEHMGLGCSWLSPMRDASPSPNPDEEASGVCSGSQGWSKKQSHWEPVHSSFTLPPPSSLPSFLLSFLTCSGLIWVRPHWLLELVCVASTWLLEGPRGAGFQCRTPSPPGGTLSTAFVLVWGPRA